jgi:phosphoribosylamine--glycine ligase
MKVLVIGSGGREHAIIKAVSQSKKIKKLFCSPGSDAIARFAECIYLDLENFEELGHSLKELAPDLVIVGPEEPLVRGIADKIRSLNIPVFGPTKAGALLEGSKIASKKFMESAGVPTAQFIEVTTVEQTMIAAKAFKSPWILKADGLAAGKGVFICKTLEELESSAKDIFVNLKLGEAGKKAVLEENLPGWEMSYFVLTDGKSSKSLPVAQDHKRLKEKDQGPNTGGMGAVAPIKLESDLIEKIEKLIVAPSIKELENQKIDYRGVLFIGIMVTDEGPKVLEYNTRFGDPETQVLLPLLDGDWLDVFLSVANGELPNLKWNDLFSCVVIGAAEGYPDSPVKGTPIDGDILLNESDAYIINSGTRLDPLKGWVTNGGRVLGFVGLGKSLDRAIQNAYKISDQVKWNGMQVRRDIGGKQV